MFSKNSHWFLAVRVYFFAIFSRQTRQLELEDFQKGLKNIYIKYPISKSNLEHRNFLDCLQNEGWGHDFQSSLQKCLIIFSFYILFSKTHHCKFDWKTPMACFCFIENNQFDTSHMNMTISTAGRQYVNATTSYFSSF